MNASSARSIVKVRGRFDLRGRDFEDLRRRLFAFRETVKLRGGQILSTRLDCLGGASLRTASVIYLVPLAQAEGLASVRPMPSR